MSKNIDLNIKGLEKYVAYSSPLTDYRAAVTLVELDSTGQPTNRLWREPYDTIRCNKRELEERFERRINGRFAFTTVDVLERYKGDALAVQMAERGVEMLRFQLKPILRGELHKMIHKTKERIKAQKGGVVVLPEQVISENAITDLNERVIKAIQPILERLLRETNEACRKKSVWQWIRHLLKRDR